MGYKQFCKEPEKIENYEKAKKDNFKGWECHHRLETHTSDGERRLVDITSDELKALGMYYNRPASELIFLTTLDHYTYRKGKPKSEETRIKMREVKKGKQGYWKGRPRSAETKKKLREAAKGNKNVRGTHWYNNGKINIMSKECPPGFVPGRLK